MRLKFIIFIFCVLFCFNAAFAENSGDVAKTKPYVIETQNVPEIYEIPGLVKNAVKKKLEQKREKKKPPYMVQTYDEWLDVAQDVPYEERKTVIPKPLMDEEISKKLNKVEDPIITLVRYNIPAGTNEADLSTIKQKGALTSMGVASPDCNNLAVVFYYFSPSHDQIASEAAIIPLDTKKSRINRILEAKIIDKNKGRNITSGVYEFHKHFYSTFTIVDWSADGQTILLKEKLGSSNNGIFRTNVKTMHLSGNGVGAHEYREFPELQKEISAFWRESERLILDNYRWDVKVLGFSENNPDEAIVLAHVNEHTYSRERGGKTVQKFLGAWGLNVKTGAVRLLSLTETSFPIAANGIILKFRTE